MSVIRLSYKAMGEELWTLRQPHWKVCMMEYSPHIPSPSSQTIYSSPSQDPEATSN